jgi:hypothetical protein
MVHNLSIVAMAADAESKQAGRQTSKLGDCGDQLRKCFALSLQAPGGPRHSALSGERWGPASPAGDLSILSSQCYLQETKRKNLQRSTL